MRKPEEIIIRGLKLSDILERHKHWLNKDVEGWQDMRADLSRADLCGADLPRANLSRANLSRADLSRANLCGANLSKANLSRANLCGANLSRANLCGAYSVPFIPYACPDFGIFIGYKKCKNDVIVELEIPEGAKRFSSTGRKCRCDKAKVLRFLNINREEIDIKEAVSNYDNDFIYKKGEVVTVENFCEDRFNECSAGIHFFINFQEAVEY